MVRALILVALLAGCEPEVPRTVDYYLANTEERAAKAEACRNDVRLAVTPNCVNADEANRRAMLQGRTMPRMRL